MYAGAFACACVAYLRHQSFPAHPWLFASMIILPDALPQSCEISSFDSLLFFVFVLFLGRRRAIRI